VRVASLGDMLVRLAILSLLLPATAFAEDPVEPAQDGPTTSYRSQTLVADGVGLALLVGGGLAESGNGRDTGASDAMFTVGGLTIVFATPIIHGARGHGGRAVGSFLMRGGLAAGGALLATAMNSGCHDSQPPSEGAWFDDDFLCELDYIGYGMIGGLVLASVIDAAFMTDEPTDPARWAPQVAASHDGVRVGAMFTW